jgi:predicted MFS family arabinose efflux permease
LRRLCRQGAGFTVPQPGYILPSRIEQAKNLMSIPAGLPTAATIPTLGAAGTAEFRRGWPVVLAACGGIALGSVPIPYYEIGLLAPELARSFGWGMGSVMAGVFFLVSGSLIASPLVGALADRYGARRVALLSILCFSVCLGLFSVQSGSLPLYYANWFFMALTGAGTLPILWSRLINQHFDVRKGLALGIALAGTGLSGFVLKPATAAVMAAYGWRGAFLFLAVLPLLIALPLAGFFLREPVAPTWGAPHTTSVSDGRTWAEAVRDFRFWLIGLSTVPVAFAISGPIANFESILRGHGLAHASIGRVVPFVGLAVIAGRVGGGWLVDRFWAPAVAMGLFTVSAASAWLVVNGPATEGAALIGVLGVGLAAGMEFDLVAYLTARYFGPRSYGSIYGTMYAFYALGAGISPAVYGRAFDLTKSFTAVVSWSAGAMFVGGLLLLCLGDYRYRSADHWARPAATS